MVHISIEYVILVPVLFIQILVFPFAAQIMATTWADTQKEAELQTAADYLASMIQQTYLSVNREGISAGSITLTFVLPTTIHAHSYTATGTLRTVDSTGILTLLLELQGTETAASASAMLGSNTQWDEESVFQSISSNAAIHIQKFVNNTIHFSFGS